MNRLTYQYTPAVCRYVLIFLVILTIFAIFIPLDPYYPGDQLDDAWAFAMSEASNRGLVFGRDIIFTLGPYANLFTHLYNPLTDNLILISAGLFATCFAFLLITLTNNRYYYLLLVYEIALLTILNFSDQLLVYPLLLSLVVYHYIQMKNNPVLSKKITWKFTIGLLISFIPLSLLTLVKVTFLLSSILTTILCSGFFLINGLPLLSLVTLIIPIISLVLFWIIAGQPIMALPDYFITLKPIISGYTEAMSLNGSGSHILIYLLSSAFILFACLSKNIGTATSRIFIFLSFSFYLYIAFKGGFVRHDGHELLAACSIIVASILLGFIYNRKSILFIMAIAIISGLVIIKDYNSMLWSYFNRYNNIFHGLQLRIATPETLYNNYTKNITLIKSKSNIPSLEGTTDIYSYNISSVISSDNRWSPRPIIQSYAAYTPSLAEWNLQHLNGKHAPDNILFSVQSIDGRLPALEDGLSWPTIITHYKKIILKDNLLYMKKNVPQKHMEPVSNMAFNTIDGRFNQEIMLSDLKQPLFVKINIKPTIFGKIVSLLYKMPQLFITLKLNDGNTKSFRLIPNMAKSGFILSPLIESTQDFASLASNSSNFIKNNQVKSIIIQTNYHKIFWKSHYQLILYTMKLYDNT